MDVTGDTPAEGQVHNSMQEAKTCAPSLKGEYCSNKVHTQSSLFWVKHSILRDYNLDPLCGKGAKWICWEGDVFSLLLAKMSLHKPCPEIVVGDTSAKGALLPSCLSLQGTCKEQPHWTWHYMVVQSYASWATRAGGEAHKKSEHVKTLRSGPFMFCDKTFHSPPNLKRQSLDFGSLYV